MSEGHRGRFERAAVLGSGMVAIPLGLLAGLHSVRTMFAEEKVACTGSVIDTAGRHWVVTAGHCSEDANFASVDGGAPWVVVLDESNAEGRTKLGPWLHVRAAFETMLAMIPPQHEHRFPRVVTWAAAEPAVSTPYLLRGYGYDRVLDTFPATFERTSKAASGYGHKVVTYEFLRGDGRPVDPGDSGGPITDQASGKPRLVGVLRGYRGLTLRVSSLDGVAEVTKACAADPYSEACSVVVDVEPKLFGNPQSPGGSEVPSSGGL
jgi:hypothetical protein